MEVGIRACNLKAALCCAATKDVHYYLKGVLVEILPTEIRCVAMDGWAVAVLRQPGNSGETPVSVIIPTDAVVLALAAKSTVLTLQCSDTGAWQLGAISFKPVDGRYPDYRRTIPKAHSGEAAHFNPALIAQFAKVGKALGLKSSPIIRQNGMDAAQVQFYGYDDFVGVVMPMRMFTEKHPDTGLPQWGHL